ncbi:uncharacterized protein F4807DRAFT_405453 [Annulohypoxylon truncatum]|uniref:uncharacterized protein n=1 Tax=Annulohypoxylon truncatum TaxID=327061 RepID=UPI002007C549|nr:uncharacterized protein F4807DRAFT_405453 [Annulohypoxylon truncatum]KAI1215002.1 hypothetical protein F4807DRAFT_405453 [Annulohypoxylon truncatum]
MGSALSEKDVNVPVQTQDATTANNNGKPAGAKALEYHRQMLQSKMADEKYGLISPTPITNYTNPAGIPSNAVAPPMQNPQSLIIANMSPANNRQQQYISPSDSIMSPATAKLNAFKGRVAGRVKPKSLFAQTSAKKFDTNDVFGSKNAKGAQDSKDDKDPPTEDQSRPTQ